MQRFRSLLSIINQRARAAWLIIAFFAFWQLAPSIGLANPVYLPPLSRVLEEAVTVGFGQLAHDVLISVWRIILGFFIAIVAAIPLGFVLAGAFRWVSELLAPLMTFLSQIPPFILFPVFIIILGVGETGILAVIIWSVFWPTLFSTIAGSHHIDPLYVKSARSMGADRLSIFIDVIIPSALPQIMTGMRNGLTLCFMMLIGAETMGASSGMGWEINMAQRMAVIPRIYLMALIVAVVGLLINYLFEWLEQTIVVWRDDAQRELVVT
ncbi:MAG: ABC transporter permease [Coriobacteriales bacterium]|jgi:NitT/TauT family transport system permease protein|nr:ABC transporter permease [Coriobacteriales bacterium]